MVVRGAPAIGCAAAWGYYLGLLKLTPWPSSREAFEKLARPIRETLFHTRPTAVNLGWALDQMAAIPFEKDRESYLERCRSRADAIAREDLASCQAMGRFGLDAMPPGKLRVLTHCNAGALATAGYGTALGVIRSLHSAGRLEMSYADDTRPRQQGARLTVWELMRDGIPVTLLPDTASGLAMARGLIDAVVVGADRIAANGDVANKIGTYLVAMAAHAHKIPFFVAAPLSTFDFNLPEGKLIPIEERHPDEVRKVGETYRTVPEVPVYNPAFDVTPARYVTGIITERGIISSPSEESLRLFKENL